MGGHISNFIAFFLGSVRRSAKRPNCSAASPRKDPILSDLIWGNAIGHLYGLGINRNLFDDKK